MSNIQDVGPSAKVPQESSNANGSNPDTSLLRFGYKQELSRELSLGKLLFFGLSYINIMGAFTFYGIVTGMTQGMFALAFLIATIAMLFTAYSYSQMSKAFPISGSVYTYTQRSMNSWIGFLVGWTVLMDYVVLPAVNFILVGLYLNVLIPSVPVWVFSLITIIVTTLLTIRGVGVSASTGGIITIVGLAFLAAMLVFLIRWLLTGEGAGTLLDISGFATAEALGNVGWGGIFAACALLALCFLGFDAITTFTEEAKNPRKTVGRAILLSVLLTGVLYTTLAYLAQLSWPAAWMEIENADTGVTELIEMVAGPVMAFVFTVLYIAGCFGSGIASQSAGARLLYTMGRDGVLPRKLSYVLPGYKTPVVAILVIAVLSCVSLFTDLMGITSIINFGGLLAFTMVNLCVVAHYYVRERRRGPWDTVKYLIVPLVGAAIALLIWANLDSLAMVIGGSWIALGIVWLGVQTKGFRRKPVELEV